MNPSSTPADSRPHAAPPVPRTAWHPAALLFFFWGEFAERSSFYGMKAILKKYLEERLGFSQPDADTTVSVFNGAAYSATLFGGIIADRFFGRYWTIVLFSLPYILGHFILGIESRTCLVIALGLLALGSGIIKPNISTMLGQTYDEQRPGQEALRSQAFAIFYFAINVGAVLSQWLMPKIRTEYGYATAFLFPTLLMVVSFAIFAAGKPTYAREKIEKLYRSPEEFRQTLIALLRLVGVFISVAFFWAIFDQSATSWVNFTEDCTDLKFLGEENIRPDSIQWLNSFFILVLLPPITALFWWLDRRGVKIRATDKMFVGFVISIAAMAVLAYAASWTGGRPEAVEVDGKMQMRFLVSAEARVTVWWVVLAYFLITVAEVLISVTGLELAYSAAPASMRGFVAACWQVNVAAGNLVINAPITRYYGELGATWYFVAMTAMMVFVTVGFSLMGASFNRSRKETPEPSA